MNNCNSDFCESELDISKYTKNIPSKEELDLTSEMFKAISDPLRLKIIYLLKEGELCVCYINAALDKPQSTISHHLAILKRANIINLEKKGKWNYYSLKNQKIIYLIEKITNE